MKCKNFIRIFIQQYSNIGVFYIIFLLKKFLKILKYCFVSPEYCPYHTARGRQVCPKGYCYRLSINCNECIKKWVEEQR